jgi:hypothetical protein
MGWETTGVILVLTEAEQIPPPWEAPGTTEPDSAAAGNTSAQGTEKLLPVLPKPGYKQIVIPIIQLRNSSNAST